MTRQKTALYIVALLFLNCQVLYSDSNLIRSENASIVTDSPAGITVEFTPIGVIQETVEDQNAHFNRFSVSGEGYTCQPGKPELPAITRMVIVPNDVGLELIVRPGEPLLERGDYPPVLFRDENDDQKLNLNENVNNDIYPPVIAEMSEPFIIRGVRLVKITTYPVRYNPEDNTYLRYDNIETEIRYTDAPPVNPAQVPIRKNRSPEFKKFISSIALNSAEVGRDDPDDDFEPEYLGHYLIVCHENCLEFTVPFIEWRRKSGWKVDILSVTNGDAQNYNTVKAHIQQLYNNYLDDDVDPFDHILLIGDFTGYNNLLPEPQWILVSNGHHGDWYYGCLEGNDNYADVGISRWCSGSQDLTELFVLRTLAYEAIPRMDDRDWFTRAAVYAQRWGRNYHVSLACNVRWGREVLESLNFDDIRVYENMDQNDGGGLVGPFIRDQYNDGVNVMIGRAENYYFRNVLQGVNDNDVFPIDMYLGGHQEYSVWTLLRSSTPDHPKGPVAVTCGWGNPQTLPMSTIWLEQVNGFLQKDMTFGWARLKALIGPELYFPDFGQNFNNLKTDIQYYGDPAIQYWKGIPLEVEAELPSAITPNTKSIQVWVIDPDMEENVPGAQVTFYAPGDIPDPDDADYADYNGMFMLTTRTNTEGTVLFNLEDDFEFEGPLAYITVTGRDILPYFGEIPIRNTPPVIELVDYEIIEIDGNEDGNINPGELIELRISAVNLDDRDAMEDVTAILTTSSPWIEPEENNRVQFGDIGAGETDEGDNGVRFRIHPNCPDGGSRPKTKPHIQVTFRSGNSSFHSVIELTPAAPNHSFRRVIGGEVISTRPTSLNVYLYNLGAMNALPVSAELISLGHGITVIQGDSDYEQIDAGRFRHCGDNPFRVAGNHLAVPGSRYPMMIILRSEGAYVDTAYFDLQVDEARDDSPLGPDGYGYICFDDTDSDWEMAPEYDWFEISDFDGDQDLDGEMLDFEGNSPHDIGEAIVVELPFTTQFYGREYDCITVATNGFIAMGEQEDITNFQNWPMDRAFGGGVGMLAPFWDNLRIGDRGGVFVYHDEETASFIVEWYNMRHSNGDEDLVFQAVLYDKDIWITETGDQKILFQYKEIVNNPGFGVEWYDNVPYASVGISSPDGTTGINYTYNNVYPPTAVRLQDRRALLFINTPTLVTGTVLGRVTDLATGDPVENAVIKTQHGFSTTSNEEGNWILEEALAEIDFFLLCTRQGYNDTLITDLIIEEGDTLEVDLQLLHPEFVHSIDNVQAQLFQGDAIDFDLEVENCGNGKLDWYIRKRIDGQVHRQPWELRQQFNVGIEVDDNYIQGAVFADNRLFVAGSNNHQPLIYVLDIAGNIDDHFPQFGIEDNYGIRDMAWDGELIWGSIDRTVYGFTTEGELIHQFEGPFNPNYNICWDTDRECFWMSTITSDIVAVDRNGNVIDEVDRHGLRMYGLGYMPEDPDGYPIYIFHRDEQENQTVTKLDPVNEDTLYVATLMTEEDGTPSAAEVSCYYDPYSWVFIACINSGLDDRVDIWHIDDNTNWFRIVPDRGTIDPGQSQEFTISLDATGIPCLRFSGEIEFHHNADDGLFSLNVALEVLGQRRDIELDLDPGWNQVSINVTPESLDVSYILASLVQNGSLVMAKDGEGRFYRPGDDFNNIPEWEVCNGYQLYLTEPDHLRLSGAAVPPEQPIDLAEGWNLKAYFPTIPTDVTLAVAGIEDQLIIAKDADGDFYLPAYGYNNMNPLHEWGAYHYKVTEPVELVYRFAEEPGVDYIRPSSPVYFNKPTASDCNMSVLMIGETHMQNWELGVFTRSGELIGSGCFDKRGMCGVAVWGDDPLTETVDGASEGDHLLFKVWDGKEESGVQFSPIQGEPKWSADDYFVAHTEGSSINPATFGIHEAFPNPANGPVAVTFGLIANGDVKLCVYDLSGRKVATLVDGQVRAGSHRVTWDTDKIASGVYLMRLESGSKSASMKTTVIR